MRNVRRIACLSEGPLAGDDLEIGPGGLRALLFTVHQTRYLQVEASDSPFYTQFPPLLPVPSRLSHSPFKRSNDAGYLTTLPSLTAYSENPCSCSR